MASFASVDVANNVWPVCSGAPRKPFSVVREVIKRRVIIIRISRLKISLDSLMNKMVLQGLEVIFCFYRPESTSARQSLDLTLACRRPTCPVRAHLIRHCARVKNPCFFPLALSLFLSRPSDERYLLDLIFSVFTLARIRGGTKGRRRPKHLR